MRIPRIAERAWSKSGKILRKSGSVVKTATVNTSVPVIYAPFKILPASISDKFMEILDKFMPKQKYYFEKLSDSFYCGAEIGEKEIKNIAENGIKRILDLKVQSPKKTAELNILCKKYEVAYKNIPLNVFRKPDAAMKKIIKIVKKSTPDSPLYVHCKYGKDRTGFVRGLYLHLKEGKSYDEVFKEMKEKGFRVRLFGHLLDTLQEFMAYNK